LTEEGCKGAPDWIVDPMNFQTRSSVYNFEYGTFNEYSFSDKVKAGIYENFEIDFAKINIDSPS